MAILKAAGGPLIWLLLVAVAVGEPIGQPVTPYEPHLNLYDFLTKGLKARRAEDFQYCRYIVDLVENGKVPEHMVRGTAFWARNRDYHRPIQYFQQALYFRARKEGYDVPSLRGNPTTAIVTYLWNRLGADPKPIPPVTSDSSSKKKKTSTK